MAKILGLDLGTNSIGWAVVDDEKNKILGMGSRIFPEGVKAETIGKGDKEESKNAARRNSRQQRRQYYRKRLRKIKLLRTLIDLEMCPLSHPDLDMWAKWDKKKGKAGRKAPSSKKYVEWHKQNPYYLRDKALSEDLTLMEMGRVLYHLIQRRGFLSNRKGKDDGKIYKGKPGMVGIDKTKEQISEKTLGSFLNSIYPKEGEPFKLITDENGNELRVRARYTLRDMYVEEFEQIWNRQKKVFGLNDKTAIKTKIQFLKGTLKNSRNKKKIEKLKGKYGDENVKIEELKDGLSNKILYKITTQSNVPLKVFLGGEIQHDDDGNVKHKSQDSVLFWQRPLRSQKGLLAKCRFEPDVKKEGKYLQKGKTPCHLSHPLYEEFRACQYINNIEYGKKQKLEESQRLRVLELINSKDSNFNFSEIPKKLKMEYEKWNYDDEQKVPGNYTTKHLSSLFTKDVWEENKEEIWHCFHFFEDSDNLIKKLKNDFGLAERDFEKVEKISLKEGYSNVSLKAIKNILPYLQRGLQMSDATILGGVRNAFGERWKYFKDAHEQLENDILKINRDKTNKEGDAIAKIKSYLSENDFGFSNDDIRFIKLYHHSQEIEEKEIKDKLDAVENLRNPIVQQGINETRRLVNQLIDEYGKFDRIQVELGREIKNSKKGRQEQTKRIYDNTTKNDEARKLLTEYGLKHNRENIQKVLLYKEMQEKGVTTICPYTNKSINISDVLGRDNKIQIEHIIPKSVSLDDSFANKTLCDAKFNGLKGNLTPYQFYLKNGDSKLWGGATSWEDVEQRAYRVLPYAKAKRFTSKIKVEDTDVKSSFIERQLNDMRYISRKTKEIMSQVCDDVRVLPGGLTAELRHLWGLNNILQPIMAIDLPNYKLEEGKKTPHYVVMDSDNKPILTVPIYNEKPKLGTNETTITGKVDKGVFKTTETSERYAKLSAETSGLENGEYWLNLKLSEPKKIIRIFKERPNSTENEIVLRGKVEKEKFKNEQIGVVNAKGFENGAYWSKFAITNKRFETPEKDKQPKKSGKQVLLFGEVKEGFFKSYIYSCKTNELDGKYWLLLDIDTDNVSFERAVNEKPVVSDTKIIVEGSVNDEGIFVSEIDAQHQFKTNEIPGKYWFIFDILNANSLTEFKALEKPRPQLEEKQTIVEGDIWVDKYTGEIKFDPKKNRDDHRHHAIDALVIALSKQSYFQQLSTYNAARDAKKKGVIFEKEQLDFKEPWNGFHTDAKKEAEKILISHKQNRKVLTEVRKKVTKNGKTYVSVGDAVRGRLHKEFFYGERQTPFETKKGFHKRQKVVDLKDSQLDKIVDLEIRKIIVNARKEEVGIKKQMEVLEKQKKKVHTDEEEATINAQIQELKKQIESLYTLKNKNGEPVPIKKVRIRERMTNAVKVKDINQWVDPQKNNHILIYVNDKGELTKDVVNFWTAVNRLKKGEELIQLPKDGIEIVETFKENDMFLLFIEKNRNLNELTQDELFQHLYKVQKIAGADYFMEICFRHHVDSKSSTEADYVYIKGFGDGKTGWNSFNPIKVKITPTGKIEKIINELDSNLQVNG